MANINYVNTFTDDELYSMRRALMNVADALDPKGCNSKLVGLELGDALLEMSLLKLDDSDDTYQVMLTLSDDFESKADNK